MSTTNTKTRVGKVVAGDLGPVLDVAVRPGRVCLKSSTPCEMHTDPGTATGVPVHLIAEVAQHLGENHGALTICDAAPPMAWCAAPKAVDTGRADRRYP